MLLDVLANFQPKEVLINAIYPELTNTYIQIRDNAESIIATLSEMQGDFGGMNDEKRKEYFYSQRERFNELIKQSASTEKSCFVYLH